MRIFTLYSKGYNIMEIKFDSEVASSYSEKHKANIESQIEELQEKLKNM